MSAVTPWVSVEPSTNPAAILGSLPFVRGTVVLAIPATVVPDDASGILVFAWSALSGVNADLAYWHFAVNLADGGQNWFSLLVAGDPAGGASPRIPNRSGSPSQPIERCTPRCSSTI